MLHQPVFLRQSLAVAVSLFIWQVSMAADEVPLASPAISTMVITAPAMTDPYTVSTDARTPQLPLPAADGGAFLKSIPGFSVSRKGGTSGDPELRGLGGSRLNILADGANILGGCGGRMDPPTAYIFPQAYDRVEIIKGPQSVRYGVAPAGVVRFERDKPVLTKSTVEGFASTTLGSNDRFDLVGDMTAGNQDGYVRLIGTLSDQDNYEDGAGNEVRSEYNRWSGTAIVGWTPDPDTRIEVAYNRSDAEAAYDDGRPLDGTVFDRTGYTLTASRQSITPWLSEVEAQVYYSYVDHVMDNFTLKTPPTNPQGQPILRLGNPDRRTIGGRLAAELELTPTNQMAVGMDYTENRHSNRGGVDYREKERGRNAEFRDYGVFAEVEQELSERSWITLGLRVDRARVESLNGLNDDGLYGDAELGETSRSTLWSGFARYEHALEPEPFSLFAGVGRAERAGDHWERRWVFDLDTETLTQLDTGASWNGDRLSANLSLFYGWYDDYILIDERSGQDKVRNVDAKTYGLEADMRLRLTDSWDMTSTLAWVRSNNDTDSLPLAQTPPLEATLGLDYARNAYFGGVLLRGVARQDRIAKDQGTIYSLDIGETPGFATVSAYGGRKLFGNTTITLGVDNLFDRTYVEHIQRGTTEMLAIDRVNEPGRTLWANVTTRF